MSESGWWSAHKAAKEAKVALISRTGLIFCVADSPWHTKCATHRTREWPWGSYRDCTTLVELDRLLTDFPATTRRRRIRGRNVLPSRSTGRRSHRAEAGARVLRAWANRWGSTWWMEQIDVGTRIRIRFFRCSSSSYWVWTLNEVFGDNSKREGDWSLRGTRDTRRRDSKEMDTYLFSVIHLWKHEELLKLTDLLCSAGRVHGCVRECAWADFSGHKFRIAK